MTTLFQWPEDTNSQSGVDEETQVLTDRGWMSWDQVTTERQAYAFDTATQTGRFELIEAVNVREPAPRRMRLIETGGFSSLTTADHRWPVKQPWAPGKIGWRTTETLNKDSGIVRAALSSDRPGAAKFNDAFVELIGWFVTEGWIQNNTGVRIGQSNDHNPQHVTAIRASCAAAFPDSFWSEIPRDDGMIVFYIGKEAAQAIFAATGEAKAPTADFVRSLTTAQLHLLVQRCMDGDGHTVSTGQRTWYQLHPAPVAAFEMACALAGIPTATHQPKDYGNRFGAVPQNVALLRSMTAKPLDAIRVKTCNNKPRRTIANDEWVTYGGRIWGPVTPSGTWLARRKGAVYFTGN
jgi:hypothetical protein